MLQSFIFVLLSHAVTSLPLCPRGHYRNATDHCIPCTPCAPGYGSNCLSNPTQKPICSPCVPGHSFSAHWDLYRCEICTPPPPDNNHAVSHACIVTRDATYRCKKGHYSDDAKGDCSFKLLTSDDHCDNSQHQADCQSSSTTPAPSNHQKSLSYPTTTTTTVNSTNAITKEGTHNVSVHVVYDATPNNRKDSLTLYIYAVLITASLCALLFFTVSYHSQRVNSQPNNFVIRQLDPNEFNF